jgi:hypothetical protein
MRNKILIGILALIFVALSSVVYADVPVNYALREATVLDDGSISYSTNPVTDVNVLGYACADSNCNSIAGAPLWNLNSGSSDVIQVVYPKDLPDSGYYAVFFYKEGYIPYEIKAWWHGNANAQSSTAYLSKAAVGRAPIDSFSVTNDVQPNVPVVVEVDAKLDAITYAALANAGPVGYVPFQLSQYYSVETEVRLRIYDEDDHIVHENLQVINIPYSASKKVVFMWLPKESGDYRAVATTFVVDSKFLTSEQHSTEKEFTVIEEDPKNMCYTLLNDLKISNQFPGAGETITISGTKVSNYADENYVLTAVPAELVLQVFDNSGAIVKQQTLDVNANENVADKETFSFEWTPANPGWYDILVTGSADSNLCFGLENPDETERIKILVSAAAVAEAPVLAGIPDQVLEEGDTINSIDLWAYAADSDTADKDLFFNVAGQSNEDLTVCSINSNRYLECTAPDGYGVSQITVEVSDGTYSDRDSFDVVVKRYNTRPIIGNIPNVKLLMDEEVTLDLDNFVVDDEDFRDLKWEADAENVWVIVDPFSGKVTFKSQDKWHGTEHVVFTVTDSEGLTDSDVCVVTVSDEYLPRDELGVAGIGTNDVVGVGEILQLNLKFDNRGNQDLKDVRISASILDLDVRNTEGPFDLDEDEQVTKSLVLDVPEDAEPGYYYVRISVSNNEVRRVVHREFIIE